MKKFSIGTLIVALAPPAWLFPVAWTIKLTYDLLKDKLNISKITFASGVCPKCGYIKKAPQTNSFA